MFGSKTRKRLADLERRADRAERMVAQLTDIGQTMASIDALQTDRIRALEARNEPWTVFLSQEAEG